MERREKRCREGVVMLEADRPDEAVADGPEQSKSAAQNVITPTIEISDADYRTLHLPCDALEESGDGEPGR
jgi:hypothetical protein